MGKRTSNHFLNSSASAESEDLTPERILWMRVILQARQDADSNVMSSVMNLERWKARRWLTEGSSDFANVCRMAGFEPDYVQQHFINYFREREES